MSISRPRHPSHTERETDAALVRSVRHEVLEELAMALGTDLLNIFTLISGNLQLQALEAGTGTAQPQLRTQDVFETAARGVLLANGLLACAAPLVRAPPRRLDLELMIQDLLPTIQSVADREVAYENHSGSSLWAALCAPEPIAMIFQVLARHARQTSPRKSKFCIRTENASDRIRVTAAYDGTGLNRHEIDDAFRPRFLVNNAKPTQIESLSASYGALRRYAGDLSITSVADSGVSATITLTRAKWMSPDWFTPPHN